MSARGSRKRAPAKPGELTFTTLIERREWKPLPAVVLLAGESRFLRKHVERRFIDELFGGQPTPALERFDAAQDSENLLARVLDELRTVSILSEERLVIVDGADQFLSEHRDDLLEWVERGFSGGHLILHLDRPADARTKFVKAVAEHGWVVACRQPFDRPPPWQTDAPPWDNDLTRWIVAWAMHRGLEIDFQTAYALQERAGTDLGVLDECLEKIRTYIGGKTTRVDLRAVTAVAGDTREDSIFDLVDAFIAGDRPRAIDMAEKLFRAGYHPPRGGNPVFDAGSITIMFTGALVSRLRGLRRAHAMRAAGMGPDRWIEARLTTKPFTDRFRRDLGAMSPGRIAHAFESLLQLDRSVKSGGNPRLGLTVFLAGG